MLGLGTTGQFSRDLKRENAGPHGADLKETLEDVTNLLRQGKALPAANRDHPLRGKWKGCRDCHLKPNLVLVYRRSAKLIELVRLGSHSELFG